MLRFSLKGNHLANFLLTLFVLSVVLISAIGGIVLLNPLSTDAALVPSLLEELNWPRIGSDAGMSKYTASDLPALVPMLAYKKRFHSTWVADTGNYSYGHNIVIRNGQAVIFSDDVWGATSRKATLFDWQTGNNAQRVLATARI